MAPTGINSLPGGLALLDVSEIQNRQLKLVPGKFQVKTEQHSDVAQVRGLAR
jgi:hypothetical protein